MKLNRAVGAIRAFNKNGIHTCLSFLPVEKSSPEKVERDVLEYNSVLKIIHNERLDSEVTVKLHQLGVLNNEELARRATEDIVTQAKLFENFVWIDMERPSTVDATIRIFNDLHDIYGNVGICLQTYLKRTRSDAEKLLEKRVPIRLVKGFYKEHDIRMWTEVTRAFSELMDMVFEKSSRPCIGTHDLELVEKAKNLIQTKNIKNVEFQFFKGVRDELALTLAKEGYNVRIYIPYGNVIRYLLRGLPTFDNPRHIQRILRVKKIV